MPIRIRPADARDMEMIDEYIAHLRRSSDSERTPTDRRNILYRLNRELPYGVGEVTTDELRAWLYRDGWSKNTRATYYRCITSFYRWAADPEDPWLTANPAARLEPALWPSSVPRACTDGQLKTILGQARTPIRIWAVIAAYQGLRCCEIAGLDRQHITERELFVVRGKGGAARTHDTDPLVWATVKDLPPGPVACTLAGDRASGHYVSATAAEHFRRDLKVPVTMHQLRHWLGRTLQREHRDIRVTQRALGHKHLSSTQVYTDADDEQMRAARSTLPRFA
jgi:site-specific recombinase XerD